MADGTERGSRSILLRHLAARHHDGACPEVFLLVDTLLVNRGTVKSDGDERVRGIGDNLTFGHRLDDALSGCREHTDLCQHQNDADKDDTKAD